MKNTFTLLIIAHLAIVCCFAQPGSTDPWPGQECQIGFGVAVRESFPPQYVFIPSVKDSLAQYFWDFGDNTYSNEMNPVHVYDISGTYIVNLYYTSKDSCIGYYSDSMQVQGYGQCKAFWQAYAAYPGDSSGIDISYYAGNQFYIFQDQSRGSVISWKWDFGDGTFSTEQNPVHYFEKSGYYKVSLVINTSDNCSDTYEEVIYTGQPTYCEYTGTVKDYTGLDGCGLVIVLDMGIVLEPVEIVPDFALYDGQRVILGYTELKDRASICMTGQIVRIDCITEISGDSCSAYFTHYPLPWVSSVPPIYRFEMQNTQHQVTEVLWDFGDGTVSNELTPDHRFERDDYYTVCLTIKTKSGCTSTYCETSFYDGRDPIPPLCDNYIRLTTDIILNGQQCNGTATAALVDNWGNPVQVKEYLWSTGETGPVIDNLCPGATYSIIVTDTTGCAVSGSFSFGSSVVYPDSLIGYWNYQQDYLDFVFNLPVYSDDVYCRWNFGDGETAEGTSVSHSYETVENYTVELEVFDLEGNLLFNQQILVSAGEPTAIGKTSLKSPVVYPVPAKEWLYLELPEPDLNVKSIEILTAGGQILLVNHAVAQHDRKIEINVSQLPSGLYIGKLAYENGIMQTFRFVK